MSPLSDRVLRLAERWSHKGSSEVEAAQRTLRHYFGVRLFGADYSGVFFVWSEERLLTGFRLNR